MDLKTFCGKDASYFRNRPRSTFFAGMEQQQFSFETADRAVEGDVTVVSLRWKFPDGRIDFLFDATKDDPPENPEWTWQLNRMYFWKDMALAYLRTGDEKYALAFDRQVNDWINTTADPALHKGGRGSAWRTIEAGIRLLQYWPLALEVFRRSPSVPDRTIEKMILSMVDQAQYAYENRTGGNILAMEMCGCCTLAALFPELPVSAKLWEDAKNCLEKEIICQMLPDGMQNELSPDYQSVVYTCGSNLYDLAKCAGLAGTFSKEFIRCLEKYPGSTLDLATPRFTQPRTNDCFTLPTAGVLQRASKIFPGRKDFLWGATNGKEGTPPSGTSRHLPYAGFTAMRSSWSADAAYLCFDNGPLGMRHIHQDKLSFQLYKGDEELIFDDGGGQYEDSAFRRYGRSAYDHNTVLVDRKAQNREEPKILSVPESSSFLTNDSFDYAKGVYDQEFGEEKERPASHTREILFIRPDYFCVTDTLKTLDGNAHEYTMLLHMDTLKVEKLPSIPGAYRACFGKKYDLLIVPLLPVSGSKVCSGQTEPYLSGWFVGRNAEKLHEASTLELTQTDRKDASFCTLFFPVRPDEALPQIRRDGNAFEILFHGQTRRIVPVDLRGTASGSVSV